MRILHVIPSVGKQDGGPTAALPGIVRAFENLGHDGAVVTTDRAQAGAGSMATYRRAFAEGVPVEFLPIGWPSRWGGSLPLRSWLKEHIGRFDVVYLHSFFTMPTLYLRRPLSCYPGRFILRPLGQLDPWSLEQSRLAKRAFLALVGRGLLSRADRLHVTSRLEADSLAGLGFGHKTVVVPHFIPVADSGAPRAERAEGCRVVFLSRIHPKKGLEQLLRAIALVAREDATVTLDVAGSGERRYEEGVRRLAAELGLENRVRFHGHLSGADKASLLQGSNIFALPSYAENFGIAAAEAMAEGLPVIVTRDVGLAADVADCGAGVVLDGNSPDKLAKAILGLRGEAGRVAGGRAVELVRCRYSLEEQSRALNRLLDG